MIYIEINFIIFDIKIFVYLRDIILDVDSKFLYMCVWCARTPSISILKKILNFN